MHRDKIERILGPVPKSDYYYKLYGEHIVNTYRKRAKEVQGRDWFSSENNFGTPLPVTAPGKRPDGLASFWEFVQFVIDTP